jgi:hypothetical protein
MTLLLIIAAQRQAYFPRKGAKAQSAVPSFLRAFAPSREIQLNPACAGKSRSR